MEQQSDRGWVMDKDAAGCHASGNQGALRYPEGRSSPCMSVCRARGPSGPSIAAMCRML